MASAQCQKPATTVEVCQPKNQQSSFGQKISEITSKAFKGHHARHASNPNQLQCYSQTQVESNGNGGSKTETHYYGQTQNHQEKKHGGQTQNHQEKKHGVSKTHITVTVVQAQITQTIEDDPSDDIMPTKCFGPHHAKKNGEPNNKKEMNLFRRIKNGMSRHSNEGSNSSSDSDSDNEKCSKTKASATKSTPPATTKASINQK